MISRNKKFGIFSLIGLITSCFNPGNLIYQGKIGEDYVTLREKRPNYILIVKEIGQNPTGWSGTSKVKTYTINTNNPEYMNLDVSIGWGEGYGYDNVPEEEKQKALSYLEKILNSKE